jgi:hypothetical protein
MRRAQVLVALLALLLCGTATLGAQTLPVPPPLPSQAPPIPAPPGAQASAPPTAPSIDDRPCYRNITAKTRVEVRCGAGDKHYTTSYLNPNEKVLVLRESKRYAGWLEIKPPAGSYSLINSRYVTRYGHFIGAVVADEGTPIPTEPGSAVVDVINQKQKCENEKPLSRGTLVVILDDKGSFTENGNFLPIQPTPEEVRYIPKEAVEGSVPEPVAAPSSLGSTAVLIAQADQAFKAHDLRKAQQLYIEAAQASQDLKERAYCGSQIDVLNNASGASAASQVQQTNLQNPAGNSTSPYRLAVNQTVTNYAGQANNSPGAATTGAWSKWGFLRPTIYTHEGQPMYRLEDTSGRFLTYATTSANLTLDRYVNRMICLWGATGYRSDGLMRNNYMVVTYVAFPQNGQKK